VKSCKKTVEEKGIEISRHADWETQHERLRLTLEDRDAEISRLRDVEALNESLRRSLAEKDREILLRTDQTLEMKKEDDTTSSPNIRLELEKQRETLKEEFGVQLKVEISAKELEIDQLRYKLKNEEERVYQLSVESEKLNELVVKLETEQEHNRKNTTETKPEATTSTVLDLELLVQTLKEQLQRTQTAHQNELSEFRTELEISRQMSDKRQAEIEKLKEEKATLENFLVSPVAKMQIARDEASSSYVGMQAGRSYVNETSDPNDYYNYPVASKTLKEDLIYAVNQPVMIGVGHGNEIEPESGPKDTQEDMDKLLLEMAEGAPSSSTGIPLRRSRTLRENRKSTGGGRPKKKIQRYSLFQMDPIQEMASCDPTYYLSSSTFTYENFHYNS